LVLSDPIGGAWSKLTGRDSRKLPANATASCAMRPIGSSRMKPWRRACIFCQPHITRWMIVSSKVDLVLLDWSRRPRLPRLSRRADSRWRWRSPPDFERAAIEGATGTPYLDLRQLPEHPCRTLQWLAAASHMRSATTSVVGHQRRPSLAAGCPVCPQERTSSARHVSSEKRR